MQNKKQDDTPSFKAKASVMAVKTTVQQEEPISVWDDMIQKAEDEQNWDNLETFSREAARGILVLRDQTTETLELIQAAGVNPSKLNELTILINKTNQDIELFWEEYKKIHVMHEGRTGKVTDADDRVRLIAIYEEYVKFTTFFQGALHNTMIAFTDFAIEAREKLIKQQQAEEAAQNGEVAQ